MTTAGWLLYGGPLGLIAFQLDRARSVGGSAFGSEWDQRIEVLSFLVLPPNMVVLVPAALIAGIATWMSDDPDEAWLSTLLRLVAVTAVVLFVIGAVSIVSILVRDDGGPIDAGSIYIRVAGMSLAAGIVALCRACTQLARLPHD